MSERLRGQPDPLTAASRSVAVLIALNKPVYPVYVWFLAPDAFRASLATLVSFVFYAGLPFLARKFPFALRTGLVVVGTLDTALISVLMGFETGAYLFLFPCMMLAAYCFYSEEKWWSRAFIASVFCIAAAVLSVSTDAVFTLSGEDIATLFKLNAFGAVALTAYLGLRFPLYSRQAL